MEGRRITRPGLPMELRRGFWLAIREGQSMRDAAVSAGVSLVTAQKWFGERGGVKPPLEYGQRTRCLTFVEREQIALLRAAGRGVREIARELDRRGCQIFCVSGRQ